MITKICLTLLNLIFFIFPTVGLAQSFSAGPLICNGSTLVNRSGPRVFYRFKSSTECQAFIDIAQSVEDKDRLAMNLSESSLESEDVMVAFKNGAPNETVGFPQKNCRVPSQGGHLTRSQGGYLVPECSPDTLYSWGGFDKLKALMTHMEDGWGWNTAFPRTLFTTPSAAGTFGYGPIPVRFKIKPGVKFKLLVTPRAHGCEEYLYYQLVTAKEIQDTIVVKAHIGSNYSYLEYSLCSPSVIESWSFAMPDHYDEILADHQWMTSKDPSEWEAYSKYLGKNMYLDNTIDQHQGSDFRLSYFITNMKFLRALTKSGLGRVIFPTKYWRKEPQIEKHFQTANPIYFNPK